MNDIVILIFSFICAFGFGFLWILLSRIKFPNKKHCFRKSRIEKPDNLIEPHMEIQESIDKDTAVNHFRS